MDITIRQESDQDFQDVFNLIKNAFEREELSDHEEHHLVERLRKSDAFVPELSLVAEVDNQIVGHILLTKINIVDENMHKFPSLALAPVSVLRDFQGKGIGGKLILAAHQKAKELNYNSIIVLGHENFYPRFGYKPSVYFGIKLPFDVPEANAMAIELDKDALKNVNGIVQYAKEFGI